MKNVFFIVTILLSVTLMSGFAAGKSCAAEAEPIMDAHPGHMFLAGDFILLALDNSTGKWLTSRYHVNFGLTGCMLFQLEQMERIRLKEKKVLVCTQEPTGDPILDRLLDLIKSKRKPKSVAYWMKESTDMVVASRRPLMDRMAQKGLLQNLEAKTYTATEAGVKREMLLREVVRGAVSLRTSPETMQSVLATLLYSCDLGKDVFSYKNEYKSLESGLSKMCRSNVFGKAVRKALSDEEAERGRRAKKYASLKRQKALLDTDDNNFNRRMHNKARNSSNITMHDVHLLMHNGASDHTVHMALHELHTSGNRP
ncbi:MAG: GPP34 family phosphoprotein [bacterium]|nr:GPP34 family phosphoprotein [bacterium]